MLKAFEYRLYPAEDQKVLIHKHIGASRWIYNWGLQKKIEAYAQEKKYLSRYDIQKELPAMKAPESETFWLKEINSQSLQSALIHLDSAYSKFFKKTADFPVFKSKKDSKQSFEIPQNLTVDFDHGRIDLPKFSEPIKCRFHRKFEGVIKTCTIKRTPTNKYFVSILVEDGKELPQKQEPSYQDSVGIDVGIKDFLVDSRGDKIENPRHFIKAQKDLKKAQQSFSRKLRLSGRKKGEPFGKNLEAARQEVALLHEKVADQRKDFLHKVSTQLIRENQTVCVEDLNVAGMLKNRKLAKHIQDLGLGMFYSFLRYKAGWSGGHVLECGRFDASSKTCNLCGWYYRDLTLSEREWTCGNPKCGAHHDRDKNAALNIRDMAFLRYEGRGPSATGLEKIPAGDSGESKSVRYGRKARAVAPSEVLPGQKGHAAKPSKKPRGL